MLRCKATTTSIDYLKINMMVNAPSVEEIMKNFQYTVLLQVAGQPTYKRIYEIHKLAMENTATIDITIGEGAYGYLALVLTCQRTHTSTALSLHGTSRAGEFWNNSQTLLVTVDDKYTKALKQSPVGYINRMTFKVLQHMYNTYGYITLAMLQASYAAMNQLYDPSLPIEDLFDQINAAQDLAITNGTRYSETKVISITFALNFQQGFKKMRAKSEDKDHRQTILGSTSKSTLQKHTVS
eukprot:14559902-Ditylum_brightwellii.AAC.1